MKKYENEFYKKGFEIIAGLDEAGRGAWAGPIVAAICVLPTKYENNLINDSKKITPSKRKELFDEIIKNALYFDFEIIDSTFVDLNNPKKSSIIAFESLIERAKINIDISLIDAEKINEKYNHFSIIKGDEKSISIAAASILAKVKRDEIMVDFSKKYPNYFFEKHKGYGTKLHHEILLKNGPIKNIHRYSYKPIKNIG